MRRLLVVALIVALGAVASAPALAGSGRNFVAPLAGSQEVPAAETDGRGVATFQLNAAGDELSYRLIAANITDVTQSHIHLAPAGSNGGVVAFLYGFGPTVSPNGILATGTITAGDLIGALAGNPLSDLVSELRAGNAYVNVHTVGIPSGEIRGQIR